MCVCVQVSLWVCMNLFPATAGLQTVRESSSAVPVRTARYRKERISMTYIVEVEGVNHIHWLRRDVPGNYFARVCCLESQPEYWKRTPCLCSASCCSPWRDELEESLPCRTLRVCMCVRCCYVCTQARHGVYSFCLRFGFVCVCTSSGKEFGSVKLLAVMKDLMVMSCSSPNHPPSLVYSTTPTHTHTPVEHIQLGSSWCKWT